MENIFCKWENHFIDGKLRPRGGIFLRSFSEANSMALTG